MSLENLDLEDEEDRAIHQVEKSGFLNDDASVASLSDAINEVEASSLLRLGNLDGGIDDDDDDDDEEESQTSSEKSLESVIDTMAEYAEAYENDAESIASLDDAIADVESICPRETRRQMIDQHVDAGLRFIKTHRAPFRYKDSTVGSNDLHINHMKYHKRIKTRMAGWSVADDPYLYQKLQELQAALDQAKTEFHGRKDNEIMEQDIKAVVLVLDVDAGFEVFWNKHQRFPYRTAGKIATFGGNLTEELPLGRAFHSLLQKYNSKSSIFGKNVRHGSRAAAAAASFGAFYTTTLEKIRSSTGHGTKESVALVNTNRAATTLLEVSKAMVQEKRALEQAEVFFDGNEPMDGATMNGMLDKYYANSSMARNELDVRMVVSETKHPHGAPKSTNYRGTRKSNKVADFVCSNIVRYPGKHLRQLILSALAVNKPEAITVEGMEVTLSELGFQFEGDASKCFSLKNSNCIGIDEDSEDGEDSEDDPNPSRHMVNLRGFVHQVFLLALYWGVNHLHSSNWTRQDLDEAISVAGIPALTYSNHPVMRFTFEHILLMGNVLDDKFELFFRSEKVKYKVKSGQEKIVTMRAKTKNELHTWELKLKDWFDNYWRWLATHLCTSAGCHCLYHIQPNSMMVNVVYHVRAHCVMTESYHDYKECEKNKDERGCREAKAKLEAVQKEEYEMGRGRLVVGYPPRYPYNSSVEN